LRHIEDRRLLLQDGEPYYIPLKGIDHVAQGIGMMQSAYLLVSSNFIRAVAVDIDRFEIKING
jgi:hypothetical protein